jgi:hypothetical protein
MADESESTTTTTLPGTLASNGDSVGHNKISAGGDAAGDKLFKAGGNMENVGNTTTVQGDEINAESSQGFVNRAQNVLQLFLNGGSVDPAVVTQLKAAMDQVSEQERLHLRDDAWAKQVAKLREKPPPVSHGTLERAYLTIKKPRWVPPREHNAVFLFKRLVDELDQRQLVGGKIPPLLAFIEALVQILPVGTPDYTWLDDWVIKGCGLWNIDREVLTELLERQSETSGSALLIAISGTNDSYMVQAWIWSFDGSLLNVWDQGGYREDKLEQQVDQIYNTALGKIGQRGLMMIEFFLPDWLFVKPMHTWKVSREIGKKSDGTPRLVSFELYKRHLVVVRSWDRNLSPEDSYEFARARELWQDKWQRIEASPVIFKSELLEEAATSLYDYLLDESIVCYAETRRLSNDESPFWSLVFAGLPLGVWHAAAVELDAGLCGAIEALVAADKLMILPEQIKKRRRPTPQKPEEQPLPNLVLLWDDPDRQPSELREYQLVTARERTL